MSRQRPQVMGILNVTPDSFSDGGRWVDTGAAIARARELVRFGADIIDIGGESTRPGAERVSPELEAHRVLPVLEALVPLGVVVSVDTMRASLAAAAIDLGAQYINDVSGGLADPEMAAVIADSSATFIAMHWRGHSTEMDGRAQYADLVTEVQHELASRVDALSAAGIPTERLVIDPGFGFAKDAQHNWKLLAQLGELHALGLPILAGVSRKRFLADLLDEGAPVSQRDLPTSVISALLAHMGVWGVRVHDVAGTRVALDVAHRMSRDLEDSKL